MATKRRKTAQSGATSLIDEFYQNMTFSVVQGISNAFIRRQVDLPAIRQAIDDNSYLIEVLWVEMSWRFSQATASTTARIEAYLNFQDIGQPEDYRVHPNTWARFQHNIGFNSSQDPLTDVNGILRYDLQGADGRGFLIASNKIEVAFNTENLINSTTAVFRLAYRFRPATLQNYIGILQSQTLIT